MSMKQMYAKHFMKEQSKNPQNFLQGLPSIFIQLNIINLIMLIVGCFFGIFKFALIRKTALIFIIEN